MNHSTRKRYFHCLSIALALLTFSCDKFDGDQTIPAYLSIEKFDFTAGAGHGTNSSKITDAWVYVDDELIGAYELPATFPILKEGLNNVRVYAGIKLNGISSTRIYYPFFTPGIFDLNLVKDSVISLSPPSVTYSSNTVFTWMEDFEGGGSSLEKTSRSDTSLVVTHSPDLVFEGANSGLICLGDSVQLAEVAMMTSYALPTNGTAVFLEMNYRNNNTFTVGVFGIGASQTVQKPVMVLNPSDTWNKIYINLTPFLQEMSTSLEFKIFLGATVNEGVEYPLIQVDNFKLIHL